MSFRRDAGNGRWTLLRRNHWDMRVDPAICAGEPAHGVTSPTFSPRPSPARRGKRVRRPFEVRETSWSAPGLRAFKSGRGPPHSMTLARIFMPLEIRESVLMGQIPILSARQRDARAPVTILAPKRFLFILRAGNICQPHCKTSSPSCGTPLDR
jgi:hypothetical protein